MLGKLNKIKGSLLSTLVINTHNELSCNNSKFENLQKEIVKLFFFFFVNNQIYSSSLFIKIFSFKFLNEPLNKIPGATVGLHFNVLSRLLLYNSFLIIFSSYFISQDIALDIALVVIMAQKVTIVIIFLLSINVLIKFSFQDFWNQWTL